MSPRSRKQRKAIKARERARGPRRTTAAAIAERTPWQQRRDELLRNAGLTKADVYDAMRARGLRTRPSSVRAVLDGRYRNTQVETTFCRLTHADPAVAFPLDEPPYGRKPSRGRMTMQQRLAALAEQNAALKEQLGARGRSFRSFTKGPQEDDDS